jgi:hypothetical protein
MIPTPPEPANDYPAFPDTWKEQNPYVSSTDKEMRTAMDDNEQLWNIKPLLNGIDNLFGGNLAAGYTDPNELAYKRKGQHLETLNSLANREATKELSYLKENNDLKKARLEYDVTKYKYGNETSFKNYRELMDAKMKVLEIQAKIKEKEQDRFAKSEEQARRDKFTLDLIKGKNEFQAGENVKDRENRKEVKGIASPGKDAKVTSPKQYSDGLEKDLDSLSKELYRSDEEPNQKIFNKKQSASVVLRESKQEYLKRYPIYADSNPSFKDFASDYYRYGPEGIAKYSATPSAPQQNSQAPSQPANAGSMSLDEQIQETQRQIDEKLKKKQ